MSAARHSAEESSPQAAPLQVLLVGRPNSGKSSLFNALTGSHARVGNFPGVTVDVLSADVSLPSGSRVRIVDLPGTYSLEASVDPETDEGHARRYIEQARSGPAVIAQVLDSTNLALNLRLTAELLRLGLPLILLVSQRDVLEAEGHTLDTAALEEALGVGVLWVSARAEDTRQRVLEVLGRLALEPSPAPPQARAFDAAQLARKALPSYEASAGARARGPSGRLRLFQRTAVADRYLMHPALGPLAFLTLMGGLFTLVFTVAEPTSAVIGAAVDGLASGVRRLLGEGRLADFLCEGVLAGAGTVVQFLPQIVLLTVALELLEASGYLVRGVYLLDGLLQRVGLGGRSFVPLLMGHACAIPAISATRTIRDPRQRLKTLLVIPLMACSARIPTYALLIATFFPAGSAFFRALLFLGLYLAGLVAGAVASAVLSSAWKREQSLPLVIELPPYRAPQVRAVGRRAWRAGTQFLREVGTVIVAASAVLWVLLSIPVLPAPAGGAPSEGPESASVLSRSAAALVGKALEPVTRPIGFDWRINVGLIGSFGARELMVSTLGIIFGMESADEEDPASVARLSGSIRGATRPDGTPAYSTATGLALLAFFVLACQCLSTLSAIRRETRSWKWPLVVAVYTYAAAYVAAFAVYNVARLFGA
jgi:ferrous iron transport protein B